VARLMAVGDLMLARSVGERLLLNGPDWPFAGVADLLAEGDIVVGNLECVIAEQGQPQPKAYTFRAPPVAAQALARAGFDLVGLANNHALERSTTASKEWPTCCRDCVRPAWPAWGRALTT
jgi:poly-gamma-glutamate synthesis protein (capsule biosynthesis protein)